jgi:ppGpp synthetase/RelA/SpoT-type nucleotidyltranferase
MNPEKRGLCQWLRFAGAALLAAQLSCAQAAAPLQAKAGCKAGDDTVAQYQGLGPAEQNRFVENYRRQYAPVLEKALGALRAAHSNPPFRVLGRIKATDSIQEKVSRRNYACFSELTDVAGTRIVIPSYAALPLVTQNIERAFSIVEKEDLIPDQRGTGYRAIHYLVTVDGRIVEIQVHTQRGTIWAEASHRLVYKGPFSDNRAVISYLNRLSETVFLLDSGLLRELPDVPSTLPAAAREDLVKAVAAIHDVGRQNAAELNKFYAEVERDMLERDSFDLEDLWGRSAGSPSLRRSMGESKP